MKTSILTLIGASAAALMFTSCDSKQEQAREEALEHQAEAKENSADQLRKDGERVADAKEQHADAIRKNSENAADATEKDADATRDATEKRADEIEEEADQIREGQ